MKNAALILVFILLIGCNTKQQSNSTPDTDTVYLTFIDAPDQSVFKREDGAIFSTLGDSFLSYMAQDEYPTYINRPKTGDTLALPTFDGYLEIAHQFKGIQTNYYYLKGGDTVTFTYNELGQPHLKSALSEELTKNYNFAALIEGTSSNYGFNPEATVRVHWKNAEQHYNTDYTDFIRRYKEAVDSLDVNSIYSRYHTYRYDLALSAYELIGQRHKLGKGGASSKESKKNFEPNDSLISFISYATKLNKSRFDDIAGDTTLPPKSRNIAIYEFLRERNIPSMLRLTPEQLEPLYQRTTEITGSTSLVERVKAEFPEFYADLGELEVKSNDMMLKGMDGEVVSLEAILEKNLGKVLYVDFWASWCAPCIAGMPDGEKLRKKYSDVVFLYLAKGDTQTEWQRAIKEHSINTHGAENYLIINEDAGFIEQLGINAIPRYVIIGKDGKITNSFAPRPGSPEIEAELNELLRQ